MPALPSDHPAPLQLTDVRAGYGKRRVLAGLDLTIRRGEAYALLGPNGAGKSTVARVACGLLRPDSGSISVDGIDPWSAGARRRPIGLAPQDIALFPALTIRENLTTVARLSGIRRDERRAAIERALKLADAGERADQRIATLSGGWRRRANLAAALVGRPALLVIDEPTEGVDAATRVTIARGVREALGDGAACLIISHDAPFVDMTADRIGILADGQLIAEGDRRSLLESAFGDDRLVTVTFALPPDGELRGALADRGFESSQDGLRWRRIGPDARAHADAMPADLDRHGGEVAIRKPGLDDLVGRLTGRPV